MKVSEILSEDRRAAPRPVWDGVYAAFKKEALRIRDEGLKVKATRDWVQKAGNLESKWTYVIQVDGEDAEEQVEKAFSNIVAAGKAVSGRVKVADTVAVFGTAGTPRNSAELESVTMDYEKSGAGYWLGIKFNERT